MKTYRISELGSRFKLSRSTLLYYDRIGLLCPSGRTASDYRQYTADDLARLERICFFRDAGLALSEIAQILDKAGNDGLILEKRLREINREVASLKAQQRLITGTLKTVAAGHDASRLDKMLWLSLQKACGMDEAALTRWHVEFERRAPRAHHDFLLSLGLSEKEAIQVRLLTKNIEDNKMNMQYFFEVFEDLPRQGPGCREATLRALSWLKKLPPNPNVLDIGCGCGMQTQILAQELKTKILAIDNHRPMLDRLAQSAAWSGLEIETRELSMIDMPFDAQSFDLLWCEGAIFIIGLERGLTEFHRYLTPGGYFAFTEMCWFTDQPAPEAQTFFDQTYPDLKPVADVRKMAKAAGYKLIDDFNLPDSAWWDDYYTPMLERIKTLKVTNAGIAEAEAVYANCEAEAEIHKRYSADYGYTFFVLQKL